MRWIRVLTQMILCRCELSWSCYRRASAALAGRRHPDRRRDWAPRMAGCINPPYVPAAEDSPLPAFSRSRVLCCRSWIPFWGSRNRTAQRPGVRRTRKSGAKPVPKARAGSLRSTARSWHLIWHRACARARRSGYPERNLGAAVRSGARSEPARGRTERRRARTS